MRDNRDRRIRRATLKAVPRDATVDPDALRRDFGRALGCLSTETSRTPIDIERGLFDAQLEIIAYRTDDGDLEYRVSYVHPRDPRTMETGETAVCDAFDYATLSGFARWELTDLLPADLLDSEAATAYSLVPKADGSEVKPGAELAALIRALDRTTADWAVQILLSNAGRLVRGSGVGIEIRVVCREPSNSDVADSSSAAPSAALTTFAEERVTTPLELRTWDSGFASLFSQGVMRRDRTVSVPVAHATGYCPPPRRRAIRTGIGGTVSDFDVETLERVRHLTTPRRVLGVEAPFADAEPGIGVVPVGVPYRAASVLSVVGEDNLTTWVGQVLAQHVETDSPTFVFADEPELITYCAKCYCHVTATDDRRSPDLPEYIDGTQLDAFANGDRISELRPWFEDLLGGDSALYLIDLSGHDPRTAGEHATLLAGELGNAAAAVTDPEESSGTVHAGNALVAVPEVLEGGNPRSDTLESALRLSRTTGLALDVIATFDTATANDATAQTLRNSVDAVVADNGGPAAQFVAPDQSPGAQEQVVKEFSTPVPEIACLSRIDSGNVLSDPVVLPLFPPHVTRYCTDPKEFRATATQREALPSVLDRLSTVSTPSVGSVDADALAAGALDRAAAESVREGHVPRRTGLPPTVEYDDERDCYTCVKCLPDDGGNATRRDVTNEGLRRAIECCSSLDDIDRDALRRMPVPSLKLTPEEIDASDLRRKHLRFLKGLYLVETEQVDPDLEYDPLVDSGVLIRDDYGLSTTDITLLSNRGYISGDDDDDPHVLFTLTSDGRHLLNEPWREGHEYGPDIGELTETLQHQTFVRAARLDYDDRYGDDPDRRVRTYVPVEVPTPTGEVVTMYIDVAVVDDDGNIVHATEAERVNHDQSESVRATYRKLRAADPETARWVVADRTAAADLFSDLATEAAKGKIEYDGTTYSAQTAIRDMIPDEPGITDIETIRTLIASLDRY